jgi:hypothetical protein
MSIRPLCGISTIVPSSFKRQRNSCLHVSPPHPKWPWVKACKAKFDRLDVFDILGSHRGVPIPAWTADVALRPLPHLHPNRREEDTLK